MDWNELEIRYDKTKMKENIESQGRSIEITLKMEIENVKKLIKRVSGYNKFIFSGCGDKHIVALAAQFIWNYVSDKRLDVIQSKVLDKYPPKSLDKNTCVVFLSQSGTTADTIKACNLAINRGAFVVCITNLKERKVGSLIELCENYSKGLVLRTHTEIYPEVPLPSTATFHTSLALLNIFTLLLNNKNEKLLDLQVNVIPKLVDRLSRDEQLKNYCKKLTNKMRMYDNFYVVGDGPRYPIARKHAKIMMMEGVKTNACDVESEEFIHSLIETLEGKVNPLMLLTPVEYWYHTTDNYQIIKNIWPEKKVIELNPFDFLSDEETEKLKTMEGDLLSPFLYIVPCEWLSYYTAISRKIDPGKAKLVDKVRNEDELHKFLR